MSQQVVYANGLRGPQINYDNPNFRQMPMDLHGPMRGHYGPESHLTGPRAPQISYDAHDPRVMVYRDLDQGRSEMLSTDWAGQNRVILDGAEQPRQVRTVPVDSNSRCYGQSELASVGQSNGGSWSHLSFEPQLAAELNTIPNSQSCIIGIESTSGHSSVASVPPAGPLGPASGPSVSPRSTVGRTPRSLTGASEGSSNSDDNFSTARTAIEPTSDSDTTHILSRITSIQLKIQEDYTTLIRMVEKIVDVQQQITIANKDIATANSTRLNDFRDHVDKKFERSESRLEIISDELWERLGQGILESKRIRDLISGNDPRRTPPTDGVTHLSEPSKRRRFDD